MRKTILWAVLALFAIIFYSCSDDDNNSINPEPDYAFEARPQFFQENDIGVLVIHGFTGSPQSMREVAYKLNQHGYTVSLPLLAGHGRTPEIMETTTYKDWVKSVNDAYNELRPKVKKLFVLGLSMGGTQTLHCAANNPVDGAITVNAFISLNPSAPLPTYEGYPRFFEGIGSDIKKPGVTEWAYNKTPLACYKSLNQFGVVTSNELPNITCPILIFRSLEDHVVRPASAEYIYNNVSSMSKNIIDLANSYHVATLDYDQDLIVEQSHLFIQQVIQ